MKRLIPIAALIAACAPSGATDDAGVDAGLGRTSPCPIDDDTRPEKANPLAVDAPTPASGFLCPLGDLDWYAFDLPAGRPLLTVDLAYPRAAASRVELAYDIYKEGALDKVLAKGVDTVTTDNRSALSKRHYLGPAGGRYLLVVRDGDGDDQDDRNAYGLSLKTSAEVEMGEPNEDCASATPLPAGGAMGALGFDGDHDAYSFPIPAGSRIADIRVTTTKGTPVNLLATLLAPDGRTTLTKEVNLRGQAGPTNLRVRYGTVSTGGTYCLVIQDDDDNEADPDTTYSIAYTLDAETDPQETATRNDSPFSATLVPAAGGTYTGKILSKGDLDWFKLAVPEGNVVEVDLDCPGCTLEPTVDFVYGHPDTACAGESTCDFLLTPDRACDLDTDCESGICRLNPRVGKRCAVRCDRDLDCPSFQCQETAGVRACVGAAVCTAETTCGVLQYTKTARMGANGRVRTSQPVIASPLYLRVHDFQDDAFVDRPYTFTVRVQPNPDANEPNNFYEPYTNFDPGQVLRAGRDKATVAAWQTSASGGATASGGGCIATEGDIDIFRLAGGNPCGMGQHCGLTLTYDRPGGGVDLTYVLANQGLGARAAFQISAEGMETVFGDSTSCGDSECMVYFAPDDGDYFLYVRDFGQDDWDTSPGRCYTWTLTSAAAGGCPAACPTVGGAGLCTCP